MSILELYAYIHYDDKPVSHKNSQSRNRPSKLNQFSAKSEAVRVKEKTTGAKNPSAVFSLFPNMSVAVFAFEQLTLGEASKAEGCDVHGFERPIEADPQVKITCQVKNVALALLQNPITFWNEPAWQYRHMPGESMRQPKQQCR